MHILRRFVVLLLVFCSPSMALADGWPSRPVTLIVPFAAGGITDLLARVTAERLSEVFNQPFVVENVVGAAGTIATAKAARSNPDGYTFLFATITQLTVAPYLNKITYDPVKDFKPVAVVATSPFIITVAADFPADNIAQFIDQMKKDGKKYNYGAAGVGSLSHLSAAVFLKRAGIDMVMIPYKGVAPAFADLLAGNVSMVSATPVELGSFIGTGKLKFLASSGPTRSKLLPDVPAIAETFPDHNIETWNGIVAPNGTPPQIVDAVAKAITSAEKDPKFIKRLSSLGVDPSSIAKDDFAAIIKKDMEVWRVRVKGMGLQQQ